MQLYTSFEDYARQYPEQSAIVDYEMLIESKQIPGDVWKLLNISAVDVSKLIRMPRNKEGL